MSDADMERIRAFLWAESEAMLKRRPSLVGVVEGLTHVPDVVAANLLRDLPYHDRVGIMALAGVALAELTAIAERRKRDAANMEQPTATGAGSAADPTTES